jgi:hypothetical protein
VPGFLEPAPGCGVASRSLVGIVFVGFASYARVPDARVQAPLVILLEASASVRAVGPQPRNPQDSLDARVLAPVGFPSELPLL